MISFKTYISEALNKPYPYTWVKKGKKIIATAKLEDKSTLVITFLKPNDNREWWELDFSRGGSVDNTGQGDQFRIFATVKSAVERFFQEETPEEVEFSADATKGGRNSKSRIDLYDRFAKGIAKKYNMSFEKRRWGEEGMMFTLSKD